MFSKLFGKKKQESSMDVLIKAMYGDPPPPKRANVYDAINLADELLMGSITKEALSSLAADLYSGPIPYTTHDLAVSIALNYFKRPEHNEQLQMAQLMARITVMGWLEEGKATPLLIKSFEDTLYKLYKP